MTVQPIDPAGLAAHAGGLAGAADATPLRRATSAAYYAVFHAIALGIARQLTPASSDEVRYRLARSVDHGRLAEVCGWVTGAGAGRREVRPVVEALRRNDTLVALARDVVRLQRARHEADYDHLADVSPAVASGHHVVARRALTLLDQLHGTTDLAELYALVALHATLR